MEDQKRHSSPKKRVMRLRTEISLHNYTNSINASNNLSSINVTHRKTSSSNKIDADNVQGRKQKTSIVMMTRQLASNAAAAAASQISLLQQQSTSNLLSFSERSQELQPNSFLTPLRSTLSRNGSGNLYGNRDLRSFRQFSDHRVQTLPNESTGQQQLHTTRAIFPLATSRFSSHNSSAQTSPQHVGKSQLGGHLMHYGVSAAGSEIRVLQLKKVDETQKQQMQAFQQKFQRLDRMEDVMNFSRDSDVVYEKEIDQRDASDDISQLKKIAKFGGIGTGTAENKNGNRNINNSVAAAAASFDFRDTQEQPAVGRYSAINFLNHHKLIEKIKRENDMYSIQDSLFTKMIKSQEDVNLLPKKLGIIKTTGDNNSISLNNYTLGDRYAQVFSQGISSIDIHNRIKRLELMNNGLSDKGVHLILSALSEKVEELNLCKNRIGAESLNVLVTILRSKDYSLRRLNIDGTGIGDSGAARIFSNIRKLRYLDMSNNRLTDECSSAMTNLIVNRCTVNELYMHWNLLTGVAGERIAKALFDNSSIKVLDLSNNNMGLSNGDACAAMFAKLFREEEGELLHIDISNNRWTELQVKLVSDGINSNHSIFGFHMDSKFSSVDQFGFLTSCNSNQPFPNSNSISNTVSLSGPSNGTSVPPSNIERSSSTNNENLVTMEASEQIHEESVQKKITSVAQQQTTPFTRINGLMPLAMKQSVRNYQLRSLLSPAPARLKICWICDAWSEQTFILKAIEASVKLAPSNEQVFFVHVEFDAYKPFPLQEDGKGNYFTRRMCPPMEVMHYFFSSNHVGQFYAKDQMCIRSTEFISKKEVKVNVDCLNYKCVKKQEGSLFSKFFEPLHISVLPREGQETTVKVREDKKVWKKEASVFAKYQSDTSEILEQAMDADWNNSKIPKFVRDPNDRKQLLELIMPLYEGIKAVYKYYSSFSPIGDVWAISKLLFTEILTKSGLVDNKTLKLSDIEIKFISSKSSSMSRKFRNGMAPDRGMVRHEFLEGLIRIAEEKYMVNGDCLNYTEACSSLMEDGFKKIIADVENLSKWRDERYWNEECDFCYKYYMQILMAIFEQYENTIRTSLPKAKYLNLFEFKKIFTDTSIMTDAHANERTINLAFNYSVQTQADEVYEDRILQLHFIEFLEALARAAEKFALSPYRLNEVNSKMTWEQRNFQPMHRKIENLIKLIYYEALDIEIAELYELQELSIYDQKEINSTMTAPVRLKGIAVKTLPALASQSQSQLIVNSQQSVTQLNNVKQSQKSILK